METHADIDANIAALRESVAKYRKIAEERKAHGDLMIAERLLEFIADLDARMAQLEAMAKLKVAE